MAYTALKVTFGALALVGLGTGAARFGLDCWGHRRQDIGKDVDALRADLDLLKATTYKRQILSGRLAEPRGDNSWSTVEQGLVSPHGSAASPPKSLPEPAEPPNSISAITPEEADYRAGVIIAANEKALSDSYASETHDPEWSAPAATTLRSAYQGEGFEGVTTVAECRSTLCRVDFRYDDRPGAELNWRNIMHRMPWSGSGRATFNAETRTGSFFIAREGYDLPNVDVTKLEY